MQITDIPVDGYERVVKAEDPESGLRALIGVHDTTLGPALGGLRMWNYEKEEDALTDVLRLSRGMTYKSAVANTGLGGGKSVIIGDSWTQKSEALFLAMGKFVDSLNGLYVTAEDVGTCTDDMVIVRKATTRVAGLPRELGGSGDPSPSTARGTFLSIKHCLERIHGSDDLAGRRIAIQGLGHVGQPLCKMLIEEGASIVGCDVVAEYVEWAKNEVRAEIVDCEKIFDVECDVFSPNALGAILNDETVGRLRTKIVCGAANNQLAEERHGVELKERGILYAPDFVVNAGGIINVGVEVRPEGYDEELAKQKVDGIVDSLRAVLDTADAEKIPTQAAAERVAERRIAEAKKG
jgi:leucine dehydrogenase